MNVEAWCRELAQRLPCEQIQPEGRPYLDRYFVVGWRPGVRERIPAIYLHHFRASDPADHVHCHPWAAVSLILVGAYRECRCPVEGPATWRDFRSGDVNYLDPATRHRIELLTADVWSLLLRGPVEQAWQFFPSCPP